MQQNERSQTSSNAVTVTCNSISATSTSSSIFFLLLPLFILLSISAMDAHAERKYAAAAAAAAMDVDVNSNTSTLLPFPADLVDGEFTEQFLPIDGKGVNKAWLIDLCKSYHLPHIGNMGVLRTRLRDFSKQKELWARLKGHKVRPHLGPQAIKSTTKKKRLVKKSAQRREKLFEGSAALHSETAGFVLSLPKAVPTERWNQAQHESDLDWANYINTKYPYYNEHARITKASERAPSISANSDIKMELKNANEALKELLAFNRSSPTSTSDRALPFANDTDHEMRIIPPLAASVPPPSDAVAPSRPVRSITMAGGFILTFAEDDVPPPPAMTFVQNLELLNAMWDDTSTYWRGHSYLIIKNRPIPIVYWKNIYTSKLGDSWKSDHWKALKNKIFQCKVLVQAMRQDSLQAFWDEYTLDGRRLKYSAILEILAHRRVAENERLAALAKDEYQDRFNELFGYRKGGVWVPKKKASDIAKTYRQLKGLADDDEGDEA